MKYHKSLSAGKLEVFRPGTGKPTDRHDDATRVGFFTRFCEFT
jgi:hypothetical protein